MSGIGSKIKDAFTAKPKDDQDYLTDNTLDRDQGNTGGQYSSSAGLDGQGVGSNRGDPGDSSAGLNAQGTAGNRDNYESNSGYDSGRGTSDFDNSTSRMGGASGMGSGMGSSMGRGDGDYDTTSSRRGDDFQSSGSGMGGSGLDSSSSGQYGSSTMDSSDYSSGATGLSGSGSNRQYGERDTQAFHPTQGDGSHFNTGGMAQKVEGMMEGGSSRTGGDNYGGSSTYDSTSSSGGMMGKAERMMEGDSSRSGMQSSGYGQGNTSSGYGDESNYPQGSRSTGNKSMLDKAENFVEGDMPRGNRDGQAFDSSARDYGTAGNTGGSGMGSSGQYDDTSNVDNPGMSGRY